MMKAPRLLSLMLAAAAAGALLASGGCIFSPDTSKEPPPKPIPSRYIWPGAPDSLMLNFKTAYTQMEIEHYREVLHQDFRFLFSDADVTRLNLPTSFYTRPEDLVSTTNLFSGNAIQKPEGTIPGVSSIDFSLLEREGPWKDEPADNPDFPNTRSAVFNLEMNIHRQNDATTLVIQGQQQFFVSTRDSIVNGVAKPYCELRGQRDLTSIGK